MLLLLKLNKFLQSFEKIQSKITNFKTENK